MMLRTRVADYIQDWGLEMDAVLGISYIWFGGFRAYKV